MLEYARTTLKEDPLEEVIDLVLGEFGRLPFARGTFDAVFLGNCFCYVSDALEVLERHKQVTRTGGRVISKEFDGGAVIFHPVDPTLTLKVLTGTARALADRSTSSRFDNFVGRKIARDVPAGRLHDRLDTRVDGPMPSMPTRTLVSSVALTFTFP